MKEDDKQRRFIRNETNRTTTEGDTRHHNEPEQSRIQQLSVPVTGDKKGGRIGKDSNLSRKSLFKRLGLK